MYGIIATLNSDFLEFTTVKLTPLTVMEPFSIVKLFNFASGHFLLAGNYSILIKLCGGYNEKCYPYDEYVKYSINQLVEMVEYRAIILYYEYKDICRILGND